MDKIEGVFKVTAATRITGRGGVLLGNITDGTIANGMKARLTTHGYEQDLIINAVEYVYDSTRASSVGLLFKLEDTTHFLALDWAGKEVEVYTAQSE